MALHGHEFLTDSIEFPLDLHLVSREVTLVRIQLSGDVLDIVVQPSQRPVYQPNWNSLSNTKSLMKASQSHKM